MSNTSAEGGIVIDNVIEKVIDKIIDKVIDIGTDILLSTLCYQRLWDHCL